ncbi:TadE/TadG family type IV pilus assembly protein [Lacisediminimonas sp.]|uniref:TadE/TadG family type IV pilus assembly protein n=1 Tax=Lacisediminimonas sp. TaxID=3060582 RepID=UPI002718BEF6|nr:TadE/TadG family type IV pilus assembly protein [Lacisediminimonas sp.]MDO8298815.1 pilus assembly protein TadG-related protein [Lacisediminimonas sp.]
MSSRPRSSRKQGGAIGILVALSLVTLIGFAGLAIDLGKLFVAKNELQTSADACALAASRELTGVSSTQLAIAEAAGIATGQANSVLFQSEAAVLEADSSVSFSDSPDGGFGTKGSFSGASALAVKYVRCTVTRPGISNWLVSVLNVIPGVNVGSQTVEAQAAATVVPAQTLCALPVGICGADLAGKSKGDWLLGVIGPPGGGGLTGNFKWIDFTPPAGGASELAAILKGSGACNLPATGAQVGQPGNVSSVADDWNTRFGIYSPSISPSSAASDYTGYAYTEINWPSKKNAYADFVTRRSAFAGYQGNTSTGLGIKSNSTIQGPSWLQANGADRRMAIMPVVDCSSFASSSTAPVQSWACIMMLHPINTNSGGSGTGATRMYIEYLGMSSDPSSPCATLGAPGAATSAGPLVPTLVQ